jgi:hypothetical protein
MTETPGVHPELRGWLEEIADLSETRITSDEQNDEVMDRFYEITDEVMTLAEAVARVSGRPKPTRDDLEAMEQVMTENGWERAAEGARVLQRRHDDEVAIKASMN